MQFEQICFFIARNYTRQVACYVANVFILRDSLFVLSETVLDRWIVLRIWFRLKVNKCFFFGSCRATLAVIRSTPLSHLIFDPIYTIHAKSLFHPNRLRQIRKKVKTIYTDVKCVNFCEPVITYPQVSSFNMFICCTTGTDFS